MYRVFHRYGSTEYHVINRLTNVVEDTTTKLPTAIGSAIALEAALKRLAEKEDESCKEE